MRGNVLIFSTQCISPFNVGILTTLFRVTPFWSMTLQLLSLGMSLPAIFFSQARSSQSRSCASVSSGTRCWQFSDRHFWPLRNQHPKWDDSWGAEKEVGRGRQRLLPPWAPTICSEPGTLTGPESYSGIPSLHLVYTTCSYACSQTHMHMHASLLQSTL